MLRSCPLEDITYAREGVMNRRTVAPVIAVLAALTLTACSGNPTDTGPTTPADTATNAAPSTIETTTDAPPSTEPVAASPTSSDSAPDAEQSLAQACLSMAGPIAEASQKMSEIASVATSDPQSAVDAWSTLVEAYRSVADNVTNAEVKAVASAVRDDLTTLRDAMEKVYVEQDMGAMTEFMDATGAMQESMTELQTLCAG